MLGLILTLTLAFDTNGIHKGLVTRQNPLLMEKPVAAAINSLIAQCSRSCRHHIEEDVDQLQRGNELRPGGLRYRQFYLQSGRQSSANHTAVKSTLMEYPKALCNNALRCDLVYNKHVLNQIYVRVLHRLVRHCMRSYSSSRKNTNYHDLPRHAMFFTNLQHGLQSPENPYSTGKLSSPVENQATKERRESGEKSPTSAKDLHQACRQRRRRRPPYPSWPSIYPTLIPLTHQPFHRKHQPTIRHFAAFFLAGHT